MWHTLGCVCGSWFPWNSFSGCVSANRSANSIHKLQDNLKSEPWCFSRDGSEVTAFIWAPWLGECTSVQYKVFLRILVHKTLKLVSQECLCLLKSNRGVEHLQLKKTTKKPKHRPFDCVTFSSVRLVKSLLHLSRLLRGGACFNFNWARLWVLLMG